MPDKPDIDPLLKPGISEYSAAEARRAFENWKTNLSTLAPDLKAAMQLTARVTENHAATSITGELGKELVKTLLDRLDDIKPCVTYHVVNFVQAAIEYEKKIARAPDPVHLLIQAMQNYSSALEGEARQWCYLAEPGKNWWKTMRVMCLYNDVLFDPVGPTRTELIVQQVQTIIDSGRIHEKAKEEKPCRRNSKH